jgi:tetratricopeptide (TPR) repeat protein
MKTTLTSRASLQLGRFLKALGWARGAAAAYRDAAERNPLWAQAHFELGEALMAAEDWSAAAGALGQAVRLQPDSHESRGNLAVAFSRSGRTREAIAELESITRLRPNDVHLHLLLGALLRKAQRQEDALRAFRWAVRLPQPPATLRFCLGEALLGAPAWEAVLESYRPAAAVAPTPAGDAPTWHSCLNQHPEQAPREFRRVVPRRDRPAAVSLLRREVRLPDVSSALELVRSGLRGPSALWNLLRALPSAFGGRSKAPVRPFPARPVPGASTTARWLAPQGRRTQRSAS